MKLKEIKLKNFRNYASLSFNPNPYINVFVGENASGKTNILEAIAILISGKSFKTHRDRQTLKFGQSSYRIEALINWQGLDKDYSLDYDIDKKKDIRINLTKVSSLRELRRSSPILIFIPEDLDIIKRGPDLRRKFFDQAIANCDIIYRLNLQKFKQVLRQKNELLKIRKHRLNKNLLFDSYNIQLSSLGAYLINSRQSYIDSISKELKIVHRDISGGENLNIFYKNPFGNLDNMKEIEKALLDQYRKALEDDIHRRTSTTGPQRDDYSIHIDDIDARYFASQGQQRSAILSMKLVELRMIKKSKDLQPIMLLDDVFSELDIGRRAKLIDYVKDIQVFITMAEKKYLNEFDQVEKNIYKVENNEVFVLNGGKDVRRTN